MRAEETVLLLLSLWPASTVIPWQLQAFPARAVPAARLCCGVPAFYWVWLPSRISLRNATGRREMAAFNTSYFSPNGMKLQWSKNMEVEHLGNPRAACSCHDPNASVVKGRDRGQLCEGTRCKAWKKYFITHPPLVHAREVKKNLDINILESFESSN